MKNHVLRKACWLLALLFCGAWIASAQTPNLINGFPCIPAGSSGHTYSISLSNYPGYNVVSSNWSASGGINLDGSSTTSASISSLTGTTYNTGFSKYGKGRVSVEAVLSKTTPVYIPCGPNNADTVTCYSTHTIELSDHFDICKSFSIPDGSVDNWIVGPVCVSPGEEVTYSIAPWITLMQPDEVGYDEYVWFEGLPPSFAQDSVLYFSADRSSVTFVVGQLTGNDTISVQVGKCNASNTLLKLALRPAIPAPIITPLSCVVGGVHPETFTIQNQVQGVDYMWSSDNWTRISPSNVGTSMTYQTDNTGAANIRVDANYTSGAGCQSIFSTTQVTRNFGSLSKIVSESGETCLEAGTPVKFIIQQAPTPATFNWNYEDLTDWTFADVEATEHGDEITLIPGLNAVSGEALRATLNGCTNSFREFQFNIKPGDADSITSSTNSFCIEKGETYTFSTTATSPTPDEYSWDLGEGWNPRYGTGLSITSTPEGDVIADSIRVTPKGLSGCDGKSKAVAVAYPPTAPTGINVPTSCINSGMEDEITLSVTGGAISGNTYSWDLDGLGELTSSQDNGAIITVQTNGIDNVYNVTVSSTTNNTVCASSLPSAPEEITIEGLQLDEIRQMSNTGGVYYRLYPLDWDETEFNITWKLDGETVTNPSYSDRTVSGLGAGLIGSNEHDFYVLIASTECTTKIVFATTTQTFSSNGLRAAKLNATPQISNVRKVTIIEEGDDVSELSIYPNPTNSTVNVALPLAGNADVVIADKSGKIVKKLSNQPQNFTVDVSNLPTGLYALVIYQNGKRFGEEFLKK